MSLTSEILKRDWNLFYNDLSHNSEKSENTSDINLIADFTEYNPLHNGHFHCMNAALSKVPDSLFVAIVPGLFERSGRGIPYLLPREIRAEIAVSVGADIVVEGPPMGIMGSGQYSLCLARMFNALNTDYIPRGYNPVPGFDEILKRINKGHHIAPRPYKIIDKTTGEVILNDKLEEDNYVITSFSHSLSKIAFDYNGKFIFVKRIEGVSGTKIREAILSGHFNQLSSVMPEKSIEILEKNKDLMILDERNWDDIIYNANSLDLENLNLFNHKLACEITSKRPFNSWEDVFNSIPEGFSTHFKQRILSVLENPIPKSDISDYINGYPQIIRVLKYKNGDSLDLFKEKVGVGNIVLAK